MDLGTFESLKLNRTVIVSSNEILLDASGNEMDILGKVPISISIKGSEKEFTHEFRILNYRSYRNVILGRDVMSRFGEVIFDFQNNEITMDGNRIINASLPGRAVARIDGEITIPPRTELITVVRSSKDSAFITRDFLPTKIPGCAKLYISKARVIPNVDGKFIVTVVNVGNEPTTISKRQVMGHLNEPGEIVAIISQTAEVKEVPSKKINSSNVVLDDNLNDAHKARVMNLLKKYNDIFTEDPKKPSRNNLLSHDIITETAKPTYIKPRRIPMGWEKEVNSQVEEMLKNNIIRPSKSPWNAPIILVKKKDQSMRFVCDFRNLNDITKKDTYPLPQIKDVIDKMHGAKYWTTLDAASAYWSVPLTESSKEKNAFSVPHGKFEFEVTPYGLCNAGRSYQRMIDMCLSDLPKDRILAYIDDIVIFSRTFDDHLTDLESVFIKLREANISIKLSKCVFATSQVEYLGFLLSEGGIRPQTKLKINGPWIVQRKLANGVNFEITNTKSNVTKVVHHNRLSPINSPTKKIKSTASFPYMKKKTVALDNEREIISSDDRSSTESDIDSISGDEPENIDDGPIRRYPRGVRIQRQIDGAIPGDQIPPI